MRSTKQHPASAGMSARLHLRARDPIATRCPPRLLAACLGALLLAACGGGGGGEIAGAETPVAAAPIVADPVSVAPAAAAAPAAPAAASSLLKGVSRVIVAGDSLADVGTFGFKFTVQDAGNPAGFPVLPELVAAAYGLAAACSYYMDNGAGGIVPRGDPTCTNFAVGGARIVLGDGPKSIVGQLREAAAAIGSFAPGDLVLVDGGGNDASDLAAAYLGAVTSRTGLLAFLAFLGREVSVRDLLSTVRGDDSLARSAFLYMEDAADELAEAIASHALERGATRVAVLNIPDVTLTPKFTAAFEKLVQEEGPEEAAKIRAAVQQAVAAFNARLQSRLGPDPRVLLVDVRAAVDEQIARAAEFGLSDAVRAACPVTGLSSRGLPEWNLQTCTSAVLDAALPGAGAGWWATWAFSDGFHPTPAGHRLLAATVNQSLAAANWP
ncbi:phospholipase [Ramlibacter henchirensis]|uniref:Phospholipase n=1 Tax=Ramlibacter henchirensis TaxID=204072 RepID=A0A4Z0C6W0_9BURK|nr:SGNH/GDSL hydrolase family protein [Ramlibacter henchirensis]TFZ06118.1 phospholipase [Ramlibacter henchirensis]